MVQSARNGSMLPTVEFPVILWRGLLMSGFFAVLAAFFAKGMQRVLVNPVLSQLRLREIGSLSGDRLKGISDLPRGLGDTINAPLDELAHMLPGNIALLAFGGMAAVCAWAALSFLRATLSGKPFLTVSPTGITGQGTGMKPKVIPWRLFDGTVNFNGQFQILSKERTWLFMRDRANVPLFLIGQRAAQLEDFLTSYRQAVEALGAITPATMNQASRVAAASARPVAAPVPPSVPSFDATSARAARATAPASAGSVSRSGIRFAGSRNEGAAATPRKSPHDIRRRV